MATAELDVPQLASFCALSEASINTLLDKPTVELVHDLLAQVSAKIQEHNELRSEKLRAEVELESAVRGGESKSRALKNSLDKAQKESTDLKQRWLDEERERATVQAEFENLKTSTSSTTSQLSTLQTRVLSLESSNRDTISLLDRKTTAFDSLAEELKIQHQKTIDLKKQVLELEQSLQSANATSSNAKFHEQGLQQEIEQLKRNNDWLEKELKTKSEEYSKHRKEKALRISELQRQYEDTTGEVESLKKTEVNLRRRVDELGEKADDAFQKIQQMEEAAAKKEESFRLELDAAARLQELTKRSADTEQQRQQELLAELEAAREDASEQLGKLGAELETEHQEREASEARVAELEVQIEHLQDDILTLRRSQHEPTTPRQGMNGFASRTPLPGDASPQAFSPGSARAKGGLTMTQMYSNYNDVTRQLEAEKRRNETLSTTIDSMIQEMEAKGPEIEEMQNDHARLESEVETLSSLVNELGQERDQATKAVRKSEGQVKAKITEGEVLRQQLRDLSSQVKVLLMEAHIRDQGHGEIGVDERARLEQIARGQVDGEAAEGESATARLISQNLVTFREITGLQEQNANLLKITREVGEKLENADALRKQTEDARNWEDLQQKYERCKDEVKSLGTISQSYVRERDMFRRMLEHRGQIPRGAESMFDESVMEDGVASTPQQGSVMKSTEETSPSETIRDNTKLLKDMQSHFDAYKQETATDNKILKEQVESLSKENSQLRNEVGRSNSQVSLAHERYDMLQGNYSMLKSENTELQRRSQTHSDSAAKQELRVQQVAEDLVEAKGLVESMRNESANLKAEKDFWKTIEKRITEDNEGLLNERNRLNSLNANLQNLLNEREHSENDTRRRLHVQIESLEKELQVTKNKLVEESEENKRSSQRREYDHDQNQKRIDDLVSSLSSLREELVAAKTTRDHLSGRVDELTIELRSAEERATVLQTTRAPKSADDVAEEQSIVNGGDDPSLSKEQQLGVQVSMLKRDLDLTKSALANAQEQVDQYKAISQSSEEELANLNQTQEEYRQATEKELEQSNSKIKLLEQRIEDTASELSSTNDELTTLRNEQAEHGRRLEENKKAFETELAQLKDQDDRHAAAAQYYQEDLKAQAEIAQQAQQNYENELVKHADAAKALQKIRGDFSDLKLEIVEAKTEAESARTNLSQSEDSWADSRERFEREIRELNSTRQSLKAQNDHLHKQLEAFNTRKERAISGDIDQSSEALLAPGLDNLQEVIKYLRREKEIVDVQLELSSQEAKRLKSQLDYTQTQLDETRLRLNQQRRVEADSERNTLDHSKLMDTINDLNTLRESNVTLRAESRQAQAALATRTQEIEVLRAQIEPLQAQIREMTERCENYESEIKLLKENSDRWQQRAQNVLQKYDRVDPAELEALKEQLNMAQSERDGLLASKQSLQEQFDSVSLQITQAQEQSNERVETMKSRLTEQFKTRSKQLSERIKEKDVALQTAVTEKQELETRLASLSNVQDQLNAAIAERDAAVQKVDPSTAPTSEMAPQSNGEEGEIDQSSNALAHQEELQALQKKFDEANAKVEHQHLQSDNLRSEATALETKIAELESKLVSSQQHVETLGSELTELRSSQQQATEPSIGNVDEQVKKLSNDLALAQQDAENLRMAASVNARLDVSQEDGTKPVVDQVTERVAAVRVELEAQYNERVQQSDDAFKMKAKNMAAQLSEKLREGRIKIRQELIAEHEQAIQKLETEHTQELEKLQVRHKDEIEELRLGEEARFSEFKASSQSKSQSQPLQDGVSEGEASLQPESQAHPPQDTSTEVKAEVQKPLGVWQPSEQEIRLLIQNNDYMKGILRQNLSRQINKSKEELTTQLKDQHEKAMTNLQSRNDAAKEELTTQLKGQHEKAMADLQSRNDAAKEHAVALASKKSSLQLNMSANKARMSDFRLGIVSKAAKETPQKPVEEVWILVKDAKPPAGPVTAQVASSTGQTQQSAPKAQTPTSSTFGQPTPSVQPAKTIVLQEQQPASNAASTFGRPTPSAQPPVTNSLQDQQPASNNATTFGRPTPATAAISGIQSATVPTDQANIAATQAPSNVPNGPLSTAGGTATSSGPVAQSNQFPASTGPATSRGSGIPRGGSTRGIPVARGGSNARGRGSGIARGAPQAIDTSRAGQGAQQGRGSPNSALNAGAKQFVPGNKRPSEDPQGGDGKRMRGGGGAGA